MSQWKTLGMGFYEKSGAAKVRLMQAAYQEFGLEGKTAPHIQLSYGKHLLHC